MSDAAFLIPQYRLYTREAYDSFMKEFESGEMLRMPLDSVILMLKEILKDEPTTPALLKCLEPPDLSSIERSYESLYRSNFISQPGDDGMITTLVRLVFAFAKIIVVCIKHIYVVVVLTQNC